MDQPNRFVRWLRSLFSRSTAGSPGGSRGRQGLWEQLDAIESLAAGFFLIVALASVIYSIAQVENLSSWTEIWTELRKGIKVFAILLGLLAVSAVFGGLMGFLFGIPRLLQGASPVASRMTPAVNETASPSPGQGDARATAASGRFLKGNTNLEEISDWLTKIIVGLSLVQAKQIYESVTSAANNFKASFDPPVPEADVAFLIIFISGVIGGFLFFYMETRTRVALLLGDLESLEESRIVIQETDVQTALTTPIQELGSAAGPGPTSEDKKLISLPYSMLATVDLLAAWGSAQARAGNYEAAVRALQDAISKKPDDKDLLLRLADVQQRRGNPRAVVGLVAEAREKSTKDDPELLKRELIASLYLDPPQSFEKAITIAEKLLALPDVAKDPYVHLWYAAAQGQRFSSLPNQEGTEARDVRLKALNAVKRIVELAPDPSSPPRVALRQILDPAKENSLPDDDDLEVFKNDPEFKSIIYPNG